MDALAVTVLVDCDGASLGKVLTSRYPGSGFGSAADFYGIRWLVVEPTMEAIVAVRTNAVCRMDQLSHYCETI